MCRSIRTLRTSEPAPTTGDVHAAARQYVRKLSGYREPSRVNEAAFTRAVAEVEAATQRLLEALGAAPVEGAEQKPQPQSQSTGRPVSRRRLGVDS